MFTQVCVSVHWCSPVSHSLISAGRNMTHLDQEQSNNIFLAGGAIKSGPFIRNFVTKKQSRRGSGGWGGGSHPGTAWCPAAGIPPDTHTRTSPARSRTGTGRGSWSSCTRRCLSGFDSIRSVCWLRAAVGVSGATRRLLTIAGEAVRAQLVALVAATQEGSVRVVAPLRAGRPHVTFIHIFKRGGEILGCKHADSARCAYRRISARH